jgi:hypothetical protein
VLLEDEHGDFDFRLELGRGLDFYWARPIALGERLELSHVDSAVTFVSETTVFEEPFVATLAPTTFHGDGRPIRTVTLELSATPPAYVCVVHAAGRAPVELRFPSSD